ncbi:unnamed protein product [Tetraodon nigroviridis]|uniref:(spotted green pufferfish) hypothetical protein n=1 Tax=Tetraodon nigroviridis TaxID=99883 RepID=Q4SDI2_TETNG|nr:unnamed protein product [Tetraodon nigroviridis]
MTEVKLINIQRLLEAAEYLERRERDSQKSAFLQKILFCAFTGLHITSWRRIGPCEPGTTVATETGPTAAVSGAVEGPHPPGTRLHPPHHPGPAQQSQSTHQGEARRVGSAPSSSVFLRSSTSPSPPPLPPPPRNLKRRTGRASTSWTPWSASRGTSSVSWELLGAGGGGEGERTRSDSLGSALGSERSDSDQGERRGYRPRGGAQPPDGPSRLSGRGGGGRGERGVLPRRAGQRKQRQHQRPGRPQQPAEPGQRRGLLLLQRQALLPLLDPRPPPPAASWFCFPFFHHPQQQLGLWCYGETRPGAALPPPPPPPPPGPTRVCLS